MFWALRFSTYDTLDRFVVVRNIFILVSDRMAGEDDVEETEENILYDLTIQAEWPQESEIFVRF